MAVQSFDSSLELLNSVLCKIKIACDDVLPQFEEVSILHSYNENNVKRFLDSLKDDLKRLEQEYFHGEETGSLTEEGFSEKNFEKNKENKALQLEKIVEQMSHYEKQKTAFDEELLQLSEKFKILEERKERVVKESTQVVPWRKNEFELFMTTTGIRWNFGCDDNEIRGYVAGKTGVKPFSINSDEHDSFYIANYLWDVIDSSYDI